MYRSALSGLTLPSGKWKVEINPTKGTSVLMAGDDVDARVRATRDFVKGRGGTVTDESGHWFGAGVDVFFTLPAQAWWPYDWATPTRDENIVQQTTRETAETLRAETDYASQQADAWKRDMEQSARQATDYADSKAEQRIEQAKESALTVGISLICAAAVIYVVVKD
jgi:hypothetical protein